MAEVKVPPLPEKTKVGKLLQWQVEEGESIDEGDDLVALEVNGDTLSITAPIAGVVTDIYFEDGEEVEAGEVIAEIEEE